ncbi:hypothetical protein [Ensifer sp. B1-9]|uniref:hypothetical protein n=1 Tax=Ensifer sp. B1-9 TaxID=3141455 RepID=UPI003D1BEFFB
MLLIETAQARNGAFNESILKAICIAAALFSSQAMAADLSGPSSHVGAAVEDGWSYRVTPYFWAAALSGKTAQFGLPTVDIDASFSDIFDNLDFDGMLMGEARNGSILRFA